MSAPSNKDADSICISATAKDYNYTPDPASKPSNPSKIQAYHHSLPDFNITPLHSLPQIASSLGISTLLIKSESSRLGLPAFKILGASWGVYRAVCDLLSIHADPEGFPLETLKYVLERLNQPVVLFAATDGNHGRAVARMAKLLLPPIGEGNSEGPNCEIYVPAGMYESTKKLIESEGAKVITVDGDYDKAVAECWKASQKIRDGVMVQDNAFEGYEVVPRWIVEGYSTLLREVDEQFQEMLNAADISGYRITHVVTPIGVGSLGHAVVKWAKDPQRNKGVRVIAVEPETAACLNTSLRLGKNTTIETVDTIMSGMCCGTVSPASWDTLRQGVDCSVTVGDWEAHQTVLELQESGIEAGPCGAGCLAGLRKVMNSENARKALELDPDSVVVVLCTEGKREYPVPVMSAGRS